ncbi:hypothetical protein NVP1121O_137 [Vibrio phage 1.121.O._10N.286.46.C4]|nr:hypothetical protein NVP1121O_137 [Vibrio phage 1.121.O._10N.286.46.C4]
MIKVKNKTLQHINKPVEYYVLKQNTPTMATTLRRNMNNKAVNAFINKESKRVKYGNWVSDFNRLYYKGLRVAEIKEDNTPLVDTFTLTDCGFNTQMHNTLRKTTSYLIKTFEGIYRT